MDVAKVLHHLRKETVALTHEDRIPEMRSMKKSRLIKMIERSEKFSFDSCCVKGMENIEAVVETAGEMIEFGVFHLPYSQIFIEDERIIQKHQTNYYVCQEIENDKIIIYCLCSSDHPIHPWLTVISRPTEISLKDGRLSMGSVGEEISTLKSPFHEIVLRMWMEATVAIRTLVVILATKQQREISEVSRSYSNSPFSKEERSHAYTTILPPSIETITPKIPNDGRRRPRLHLVRGYIWAEIARPGSKDG